MKEERRAALKRKTLETDITASILLDGTGKAGVRTGLAFFDHMLKAFAKHSTFDIELFCTGDLEVDDHHTVEDCALVLGSLIDTALGKRMGVRRFGSALLPMDESLARAAVDLSGRPFCCSELLLTRESIGDFSCENVPHFFSSLAISSRSTVHLDILRGENDHHKTEAAFKALAVAMREACSLTGRNDIQSTKGVL